MWSRHLRRRKRRLLPHLPSHLSLRLPAQDLTASPVVDRRPERPGTATPGGGKGRPLHLAGRRLLVPDPDPNSRQPPQARLQPAQRQQCLPSDERNGSTNSPQG